MPEGGVKKIGFSVISTRGGKRDLISHNKGKKKKEAAGRCGLCFSASGGGGGGGGGGCVLRAGLAA
jgi:hypothetical protein